MARYRLADFRGFDLFYQRNHALIFSYLLVRLRHQADAEEAFQETFLRLHKAILSYDPSQRALPWVMTIAHNVAVDTIRKRTRLSGALSTGTDLNEVAGSIHTERAFIAREQLIQLMAHLSVDERALLRQRFIDQDDFESIAKAHGTTPANTRQKLSRLLRKLRV